ncbi:RNA-binding protein, putative [Plasmodium gaboni]|uniref:RNA-binding protein, putative n=1 Tax=Plasmodium gaboni TaxID=647221 RepID=A0ABY1UNG3_9APIC|nr:RNA-binding protein, putative [Plasmodium gaboni]
MGKYSMSRKGEYSAERRYQYRDEKYEKSDNTSYGTKLDSHMKEKSSYYMNEGRRHDLSRSREDMTGAVGREGHKNDNMYNNNDRRRGSIENYERRRNEENYPGDRNRNISRSRRDFHRVAPSRDRCYSNRSPRRNVSVDRKRGSMYDRNNDDNVYEKKARYERDNHNNNNNSYNNKNNYNENQFSAEYENRGRNERMHMRRHSRDEKEGRRSYQEHYEEKRHRENNYEGYRHEGHRNEGYHKEGYHKEGYHKEGYHKEGYHNEGYHNEGRRNEEHRHEEHRHEKYQREGYHPRDHPHKEFHHNENPYYKKDFSHRVPPSGAIRRERGRDFRSHAYKKIGACKIFVGNISSNAREEDVRRRFEQYGDIMHMQWKRRFAFIEYYKASHALNALEKENGKMFFGEELSVQEHQYNMNSYGHKNDNRTHFNFKMSRNYSPTNFGNESIERRNSLRIVVKNIDEKASWQDLKDFGREVGSVSYANIVEDYHSKEKYGIIEFYNHENAKDAINILNGKKFYGKSVDVIRYNDSDLSTRYKNKERGENYVRADNDQYRESERYIREERPYNRDKFTFDRMNRSSRHNFYNKGRNIRRNKYFRRDDNDDNKSDIDERKKYRKSSRSMSIINTDNNYDRNVSHRNGNMKADRDDDICYERDDEEKMINSKNKRILNSSEEVCEHVHGNNTNDDIDNDEKNIKNEKEKEEEGDQNISSLKDSQNRNEKLDHNYDNDVESDRGNGRNIKSKNKYENEKNAKTKNELYDDISEMKLRDGSVCRSTKDIDEENYNNEETKNIKDEFLVDQKNEEEGYDDDTYTSERDKSVNEKIMKEEYINKDDILEKNDNINMSNKKTRVLKKTTTKKRITRVSEESITKVDTRESGEDDLIENEQWSDSKKICVIKNNSPHND